MILIQAILSISINIQSRSDGRNFNSDQWPNNDKCQCECEKFHVRKKDYVWNPTCNCENVKYYGWFSNYV